MCIDDGASESSFQEREISERPTSERPTSPLLNGMKDLGIIECRDCATQSFEPIPWDIREKGGLGYPTWEMKGAFLD